MSTSEVAEVKCSDEPAGAPIMVDSELFISLRNPFGVLKWLLKEIDGRLNDALDYFGVYL